MNSLPNNLFMSGYCLLSANYGTTTVVIFMSGGFRMFGSSQPIF